MNNKIKIAIVGYGNVARGVHKSILKNNKVNNDMELVGIISRRPEQVKEEVKEINVYKNDINDWMGLEADVAILCGGSAKDLPKNGPYYAKHFNTVDSFDTHNHIGPYIDEETQRKMQGYLKDMNDAAKASGNTSAISIGWDPGTFSLERVLANAFFPGAKAYGFYGLTEKGGLSMGHSDAVRRIEGVVDARQYTHAIPKAIERVRSGENPDLEPGEMHWRECFVVLDKYGDKDRIEHEIKTMPNYFKPYKTRVNFISQREIERNHKEMPHDGLVIAVGKTGNGNIAKIEYKCEWDSNPEATGSIMVAYARGIYRFNKEGKTGAFSILDFPASYASPHSLEILTKNFM